MYFLAGLAPALHPAPLAAAQAAAAAASGESPGGGLQINLFWVITAALSFVLFLNIIWRFGFDSIEKMLSDRKARIEQGLRDAEQAGRDRASAKAEHDEMIKDARREANDVVARAQRQAEEQRQAGVEATRKELERLRAEARAEIAAERDATLVELRTQVADLALSAASYVVGETMSDARQKRLVEEFLTKSGASAGIPAGTPPKRSPKPKGAG